MTHFPESRSSATSTDELTDDDIEACIQTVDKAEKSVNFLKSEGNCTEPYIT